MGSQSRHRVAAVGRLAAAHLSGGRVDSVVPVGEGTDNLAYEVNGELIVRWSKEPDAAARAAAVDREARLLAAVVAISPLPVPEPAFTVPEQGCLACRKLPGRPLLDLPAPQRSAHAVPVAATLGGLLTALHAAPTEHLAELVDVDDQPLAQWRGEAAQTYATVAEQVPMAHRRAVEAFLAAPPPAEGWTPVFSHNDLGIEHVLVDPGTGTVTGVIDWGDAAIVDPAVGVGLLYRDLGPAAAHAAMASPRTEVNDLVTLQERAGFYARCSVFEDLAYGLRTGRDAYVDKSLAALAWVFPAQAPRCRCADTSSHSNARQPTIALIGVNRVCTGHCPGRTDSLTGRHGHRPVQPHGVAEPTRRPPSRRRDDTDAGHRGQLGACST